MEKLAERLRAKYMYKDQWILLSLKQLENLMKEIEREKENEMQKMQEQDPSCRLETDAGQQDKKNAQMSFL